MLLTTMLVAALLVSVRCGRIASRRPRAALSLVRDAPFDTADIPAGLKEHVKGLIRCSIDSWENLSFSVEERVRIEANIFTYLAGSQDGIHSKKFLVSAIHVTKALKALRSSEYRRANNFTLSISDENFDEEMKSILKNYANSIDMNRKVFTHINNHHQTLSLKRTTFDEEIKDQSALKIYGEAALQMGDKKWVIDSQVCTKEFNCYELN